MQVTSTINGILHGPSKVYLSHRGELVVRSLTTSLAAHIRFPASGKRLARGVVRTSSALALQQFAYVSAVRATCSQRRM